MSRRVMPGELVVDSGELTASVDKGERGPIVPSWLLRPQEGRLSGAERPALRFSYCSESQSLVRTLPPFRCSRPELAERWIVARGAALVPAALVARLRWLLAGRGELQENMVMRRL